MSIVALFPALLSILWIVRGSCRKAYMDIYVVTLIALPSWCRFIVPGLPDPTFDEAAILPIAAVFAWQGLRRWRFSLGDLLVLLFVVQVGYSEYETAGFKEAQNLLFDMLAGGLLPYVLAKGLIQSDADRVLFAKRMVLVLACMIPLFLIEARLGFNPHRFVFDRFFPGQGAGWVTTFRYGFARAAGPYGHAILAGIMLLVGLHLQLWLHRRGAWEAQFRRFQIPGLNKAQIITIIVVAQLALTWVRGPQMGAILAAAVCLIGAGVNPRKRARWVAAAILFIGIPAAIAGYSYASVGRAAAKDASQESAAYRKELIDKYVGVALEHTALGWGRNGWPKVPGMPSIDNYYLLLSLMHGVPAAALLLTLLAAMITRLLRNGMKAGMMRPKGSSLSFRLAGIYAGLAFSVLTVYMGDNVIPLFFTLTGFAESYLCAGGDLALGSATTLATPKAKCFAVVFA